MPVKRRLHKGREHRITQEAIEAFEAGNYSRLHAALGLGPWQASPLPDRICGLGVEDDAPPEWMTKFPHRIEDWHHAKELQRALLAAGAKMPTQETRDDD